MVDLGMKFEGIMPKKEFEDGKIPSELKIGANVKVKVINMQNLPILSYKAIVEKAKIYELQNAFNNGSHVTGIILRC
ncbi:MAG: hypothetical protein LBB06_00875 [Endomicrobium sp.]|jgi:ribosomal protein S1|nr:hypothetical protein [Endomicrobium sp.]